MEVGEVHIIDSETDHYQIVYGREVGCRFCNSTELEQPYGMLIAHLLLKEIEDEDEFVLANKMVRVEDTSMPFSEVEPYFKKRIQEEPENGELRLRYANFLRKLNRYDDAIKEYEKSLQLDGNLIASLINLCDIFYHRYRELKKREAVPKAIHYFERAVLLYESGDAAIATLPNKKMIYYWIEDRKELPQFRKKAKELRKRKLKRLRRQKGK